MNLTRVVTVTVVGGLELVVVVLEKPGSQMLKFQKFGSIQSRKERLDNAKNKCITSNGS